MVAAPQQMRRHLPWVEWSRRASIGVPAAMSAVEGQAIARFVASIVARPAELHDVAVGDPASAPGPTLTPLGRRITSSARAR